MPLHRCNGAFCTYYTVDEQRFRAVVDTGSPFLMVDGRCGPAPTARYSLLTTHRPLLTTHRPPLTGPCSCSPFTAHALLIAHGARRTAHRSPPTAQVRPYCLTHLLLRSHPPPSPPQLLHLRHHLLRSHPSPPPPFPPPPPASPPPDRCGPAPTPYCFTAPVRQTELEPRTSRPQAVLLRTRVSPALDRCAVSTWRT